MRVAVIGAGAVGLGLASVLGDAVEELVVVARDPATRAALAEHGLLRSGLFGEHALAPVHFERLASLASLDGRSLDYTILCHKGPASASLAEEIRDLRSEALGALVLCQNGWGHAGIFAGILPPERIFNAVVITGFHRRSPHHVEITAHADPVRVGSLFGAGAAPVEALCGAIERGGLPCEAAPEIEPLLWGKLLYNALLNPLGALLGVPYGRLVESEGARAVMEAVAGELFAVLEARGTRLAWPDAAAYLEHFGQRLLPPTARHESSMLQDLRSGRPTEIDFLSGAVARLGGALGVPTPVNRALATLVRAAEQARGVERPARG